MHTGEVIGLAGLLGSGRTELARLLFGADRADSGIVEIQGRPVKLRSPLTAIAERIAFSSEDRKGEGLIGDLTVRDNIVLALQARRGWARRLPRRTADELVDKWIKALDVRPANPDALIRNLSGGNQQKCLLARWLITEPRLLILDEPTRGIDVGAKAQIQKLVVDLAADGMAVVFISAELEEVLRLSRPGRRAARPPQDRRTAAGRGVHGAGHGAHREREWDRPCLTHRPRRRHPQRPPPCVA